MLDQANGPLLESLGENRVVGVAEGGLDNVPGIVPVEPLKINEDALKLNDGQSRVGIIQLNGNLAK